VPWSAPPEPAVDQPSRTCDIRALDPACDLGHQLV
jgi:hypothetical protein